MVGRYCSSGTWSLLGVECPVPIISVKSRRYDFTNEVGFRGSIRFLKNQVGLWIVQECRRAWGKGGEPPSYELLVNAAEQSPPLPGPDPPDGFAFRQTGRYAAENRRLLEARTSSAATSASPTPAAATRRRRSSRKDPLTGEPVEVLWVKGSGGDLRTSTRENFSSLYQDKLIALQTLYAARADKGLKSQAEDDMVGMYHARRST